MQVSGHHTMLILFSLPNYSVGAKTQPESKCPELLANYCDMLLRKTPLSKKLTSEEVERKLKDVVSMLFEPISTLSVSESKTIITLVQVHLVTL